MKNDGKIKKHIASKTKKKEKKKEFLQSLKL